MRIETEVSGFPDAPPALTAKLEARLPMWRLRVLGSVMYLFPESRAAVWCAMAINRLPWKWRINGGQWRSEPLPEIVAIP